MENCLHDTSTLSQNPFYPRFWPECSKIRCVQKPNAHRVPFWKSNINDILSDIGLPLNLTRHSERYKDVSEVLENNPQIQHLIGHSLAGSVNAQLIKDNPVTTYGAPFISMSNKNDDNYTSIRNFGDVVSILDRGSITSNRGGFNPLSNHQHSLYGDTGKDVSRSVEPVKEIL